MREEISLSDSVKLILGCHLYPYRDIYHFQKTTDIITELIKLLEKHGDCPSIVIKGKYPGMTYSHAIKNRLAKISLKEHTYGVTLNMIKAIKRSHVDYRVHMPRAVITGLAHDIGKIPELSSAPSNDGHEHQIISARWLREAFADKNQTFAKEVINAVENHHSCPKDDFAVMLKDADAKARQTELLKLSQKYKIAPLEIWFPIETFYKRIEPYINFAKGPANWMAFSCKGLIYCTPEFIFDMAKALCEEANILDLTFLDLSSRDETLYKIVQNLRDYDLIPDQLGTNRFSARYVIHTDSDVKRKAILTPLKPAGFYNMKRIEDRKMGFFEGLKNVSPG
jgi:hypothetical protein